MNLKNLKRLLLCFICFSVFVGCGNKTSTVDIEEKSDTEDIGTLEEGQSEAESDNQIEETEDIEEVQKEILEEKKSYETLADMKKVIIDYIDNAYADGSVVYQTDDYNDVTFVELGGESSITSIEKKESGYGLILYPSMVAGNVNGIPTFGFSIVVKYASNSFLDYLYDSDCIFLAADGTRYSYSIYKNNQYEDTLYFTDMCIVFDENQREELDNLYDILQKEGLSMRIDQINNNNEYVTVDLDDDTKKNIKRGIEVYYELYDILYK